MSNTLYIILGVGAGVIAVVLILLFSVKRKKRVKNPLISRAEDMAIMVNQRILSINSRVAKLDTEITTLLAAKENEDLSILKMEITLEEIPIKIETNKVEINAYIADIKDLQDYKVEIETILGTKGEKDWKKLEELLEFVKEKFQYRYV
ncbi:MAG: hypothetical protein ACTSQF_08015 [Candidatus Heimdallarchaeaceae archaeon]